MNFKGTFSVNITPTDSNGNLKLNSLKKYLNWQIQRKIGGLIILGLIALFYGLANSYNSLEKKNNNISTKTIEKKVNQFII